MSVEHFASEKEINEQFHKCFLCDVPASWGCHRIPFLRGGEKKRDLTEVENHPVNLIFSSNSEKIPRRHWLLQFITDESMSGTGKSSARNIAKIS